MTVIPGIGWAAAPGGDGWSRNVFRRTAFLGNVPDASALSATDDFKVPLYAFYSS